jgi:hypothetical protein
MGELRRRHRLDSVRRAENPRWEHAHARANDHPDATDGRIGAANLLQRDSIAEAGDGKSGSPAIPILRGSIRNGRRSPRRRRRWWTR